MIIIPMFCFLLRKSLMIVELLSPWSYLGRFLLPAGIQTDSVLSARLQIIRIYIREDGRLVIEFKTHAKFRGRFTTSGRCPGKICRFLCLIVPPYYPSFRSVCPGTPHSAGPQVPPDAPRPPRGHRVWHSAAVERSDLWLSIPAVEGHQLLQQVSEVIHRHKERVRRQNAVMMPEIFTAY